MKTISYHVLVIAALLTGTIIAIAETSHTEITSTAEPAVSLKDALRLAEQYVADNIKPEQLVQTIDIDAEIRFQDISKSFFKRLKQFNPYGPENNKPFFCTRHVYDFGTSRLVGRDQEHIKLELVDRQSEKNVIMNGIAFGQYAHNAHIKAQKPVDIVYTIEENTYNGNTSIQLMIKDIKPSNPEDLH